LLLLSVSKYQSCNLQGHFYSFWRSLQSVSASIYFEANLAPHALVVYPTQNPAHSYIFRSKCKQNFQVKLGISKHFRCKPATREHLQQHETYGLTSWIGRRNRQWYTAETCLNTWTHRQNPECWQSWRELKSKNTQRMQSNNVFYY